MEDISYSDMEGATLEQESYRTIMRGRTQFFIKICHPRIEHTLFGQQYLQLIQQEQEQFGNLPTMTLRASDLVCCPFVPLFGRLAPDSSIQGLTLEDICNSPSYHLELVGADDHGEFIIHGAESVTHSPSYNISPLHLRDLPGLFKTVAQVEAAGVVIAPSDENADPRNTRSVQGKVFTADGAVRYFKPRLLGRERAFEREVSILCRITGVGLRTDSTRLPTLLGLVVSRENVVGMLLNWISSTSMGVNLMSEQFWDRPGLHIKWKEQVSKTVEVLHSHDIVWGDVNLCNIVIDDALNAWVIDFGGFNNPELVDDGLAGTKEGDWQGISRIFETWLPSRRLRQSI